VITVNSYRGRTPRNAIIQTQVFIHDFIHCMMHKTMSSSIDNKKYKSVVFLAWAVPTVPHETGAVGDPNGPGYVAGEYVGLDDPRKDLEERIQLVAAAADQAYEMAVDTREDPTILHCILIPEFFFRGKDGAYNACGDMGGSDHHALRDHGGELIRNLANQAKYAHWLFVCGSVIESDIQSASEEVKHKAQNRNDLLMATVKAYNLAKDDETKNFIFDLLDKSTTFAQSHSLETVRNRCYIYKQNWPEWPQGVVIEKKYVSHEDFVLDYYSGNVYSEMNVAYPYVDESKGELKKDANDEKSIFQLDGIMLALEICLDHRRGRLRQVRKVDQESNVPIDLHLIVSCGMQIQQPSVVAKTGGLVFNCDGEYAVCGEDEAPDTKSSIWTGTHDGKAHSQMTVVSKEANDNKNQDAICEMPKNVSVKTALFAPPKGLNIDQLDAYGGGEIHMYSNHPLPS